MNYLKALIANNTYNLFNHSVAQIKDYLGDINYQNIVIVPDKLSLFTEQAIFDVLKIEAYFNLTVMGISKFAKYILEKNNLSTAECTQLESKLLTLKAIQNTKNKFKCFSKKYTLGFVDEIYAKIEQIKSSACNIAELYDSNASLGTKYKYEDLQLIYAEYEKLRAGKLDSGALLEMFNKTCSSEHLKTCNVFFMGFDSLTKQGLQVLKNVAKFANYCQISIVAPYNQPNARIYDTTFLDSVIHMATQEKIECDAKWLNLPYSNVCKNQLLNYMFTNQNLGDNNFCNVVKASSFAEEIEICAKQINYMLKTKKLLFSDFAICCNSEYQNILFSKLTNLNIDVFCDSAQTLNLLEPVQYIFNILSFIIKKDESFLPYILTNNFCSLQKAERQNLLTQFNKYGSLNNLLKFAELDQEQSAFVKNIIVAKKYNVDNCLEIIEKIIENCKIYEKIAQICELFEKNGDIYLNKLYLQIQEKLSSLLQTLQNAFLNEPILPEDFLNIFEKAICETKIISVPSTTNQVFVGDTKSFYFGKKYVFVLGLNEGSLPIVLNDCGLISDSEINSETIKAKLEPTTTLINKRNKFKLFEILQSAQVGCYLFYHNYDENNHVAIKSEFVSELENLFNITEVEAVNLKSIISENKIKLNTLCFNLQDCYNANLELNSQDAKLQGIISQSLLNCKALIKTSHASAPSVNLARLFFPEQKISVSIVEKYNSCPRSAFLANGLKLKPTENSQVQANIIGTFLHEVCEKFVSNNQSLLGALQKQQIAESVQIIINNIKNDAKYYTLVLPENAFLFKMLCLESNRICEFINYEQSISDFKPKHLEKYFGKNSAFKPITINVDGYDYTICGIVDRIDVCNDHMRIIDYKTGNTTNAQGLEHLFYGTKIQLFVYSKTVANNMPQKLFGCFYLPIKNGFSKNQEAYQFSGFLQDNASALMLCDKTVTTLQPNSKLLNVSLAKIGADGEIKLKKKNNIMPEDCFDACLNYSIAVVKQTIKDVSLGYAKCSPINDKCLYCEYRQICKFAGDKSVERTTNYEITKDTFAEIDYGE